MTFDAAMEETKIEEACVELVLSPEDADYILVTHRALGNELLRTILSYGGDYRGYVECKLAIRVRLAREQGADGEGE